MCSSTTFKEFLNDNILLHSNSLRPHTFFFLIWAHSKASCQKDLFSSMSNIKKNEYQITFITLPIHMENRKSFNYKHQNTTISSITNTLRHNKRIIERTNNQHIVTLQIQGACENRKNIRRDWIVFFRTFNTFLQVLSNREYLDDYIY